MDKTDALKIAKAYTDEVGRHYDRKRAYLFGSYAKGNARKDSDIDVAVVFADFDNRFDRQVELMKLTRNIDSRIEPHPFRESEFQAKSHPLVNEIVTYGTEL